jgi:hypothetical protein
METEEIRAVMDIRELQFTSQVRQKERNVLRRGAYLSTNIESAETKEYQADDVPQMNKNLSSKITVNETKLMQGEISKHTNNDECMLCGMEGNLICCDGCPGAYHNRCVGISRASLPPGDWFCPECIVEKDGGEVCKRSNGLKGSRTIGIDPYGRTFLYACGHLLVYVISLALCLIFFPRLYGPICGIPCVLYSLLLNLSLSNLCNCFLHHF